MKLRKEKRKGTLLGFLHPLSHEEPHPLELQVLTLTAVVRSQSVCRGVWLSFSTLLGTAGRLCPEPEGPWGSGLPAADQLSGQRALATRPCRSSGPKPAAPGTCLFQLPCFCVYSDIGLIPSLPTRLNSNDTSTMKSSPVSLPSLCPCLLA